MKNIYLSATLISLVLTSICSSLPAQSQNQAWGNGQKWGTGANASANPKTNASAKSQQEPETQLLRNNDQLFPGQSRTQAMRLEAETGGINPTEDSVLKPMLKPTPIIPPIHVKRKTAKSHNRKVTK